LADHSTRSSNDPARAQRQLQRDYNRLRVQMLAAYRELEKRADQLTKGQPRRVHYLVMAVVELWRRRGYKHVESFLGPRALESTKRQSASSHKRAKRTVLDVWESGDGEKLEGLGLLRRTHLGGGRLAREQGGGTDAEGRFKGNADGFMVGPEITGWTRDQYNRLKLGPPGAPAPDAALARDPGESAAAHRERERRHQAYLEQRGLQMAEGP
jgi:hypothetical protein